VVDINEFRGPRTIGEIQYERIHDAVKRARKMDPDDPTPFYELAPKRFNANLRYRKAIIQAGNRNPALRKAFWYMAKRDLHWFVNTFVWTYDPRRPVKRIPMITWAYQDRVLTQLRDAILNQHDAILEKSREMGATWLGLIVIEWFWRFVPDVRFGLLSRTEEYVDGRGRNMKSLFAKIDWIHENTPRWLLPSGRWLGRNDPNRISRNLYNADLGGAIVGEATTGDPFRGDRLTAGFFDEHASTPNKEGYGSLDATRDATPCRIINSTPKGIGNAFYDMTQTKIYKIRMHWTIHPMKRRGLYRVVDGRIELVDGAYWKNYVSAKGKAPRTGKAFLEQVMALYPFDKVKFAFDEDFRVRSPWFDAECERCATKAEVLQELEIRYDASSSPFFPLAPLHDHRKKYAAEPLLVGELDYDPTDMCPTEFVSVPHGNLRLWFRIDSSGKPSQDTSYVIGADIATGTRNQDNRGSSNSVLVVIDRRTREMVAEYAVHGMSPENFAARAAALGRWFCGHGQEAYIVPEVNGPGGPFVDRLRELNYRSIYVRKDESVIARKATKKFGWYSSKDTKNLLLTEFRRAVKDCDIAVRSDLVLKECEFYRHSVNNSIVNSGAESTVDPSGARDNHGDRVIACALAWWPIRRVARKEAPKKEIPYPSAASRMLSMDEPRQERLWDEKWDDTLWSSF
jgi:hypothetical protein